MCEAPEFVIRTEVSGDAMEPETSVAASSFLLRLGGLGASEYDTESMSSRNRSWKS